MLNIYYFKKHKELTRKINVMTNEEACQLKICLVFENSRQNVNKKRSILTAQTCF